jgi:hypothetical protein
MAVQILMIHKLHQVGKWLSWMEGYEGKYKAQQIGDDSGRKEMKPIRGFWDYLNEHGEWG